MYYHLYFELKRGEITECHIIYIFKLELNWSRQQFKYNRSRQQFKYNRIQIMTDHGMTGDPYVNKVIYAISFVKAKI